MTPEEVQAIRDVARDVLSGTPVFLAYVHGSRARRTHRPDSDLDIGYYHRGYRSGERLSIREELALELRLCDTTGLEVDFRDLASAPLEVKGHVLEEGIRVFCDDDVARVRLESSLLSRYHDYKDEFEAMHETRLATLAARGR